MTDLCLLIIILWHIIIRPFWEVPFTWAYILVLTIFTCLLGIWAEYTRNLDIILGFYMAIPYTIGTSLIMIAAEIESFLLLLFGFVVFSLVFVIYFIYYKKLSNMGFYSDVPPILRAASLLSHGNKENFSEIPYNAEIKKHNLIELKDYSKLLLKYGIALSVKEDSESITIYIRKPSNIMKMVLIPWSGFFSQSWVKIQSDGNLKVFVSQKAYDFLDSPGSYEELCKAIAQIIDESASLYIVGDEKQALKKLGVGI